jgi:hypothetical protein
VSRSRTMTDGSPPEMVLSNRFTKAY